MAFSGTLPTLTSLTNWVARVSGAQALYAFCQAVVTDIEALQGGDGALDWKGSVLCATTAALATNTRTGNVLTASANGALGAQDGITLTAGKRLLVKNEVTGANNGIYTVTQVGNGSTPFILTRALDANTSAMVTPNLAVPVERGTVNGDKIFYIDVDADITLNTTALTFLDWRGLATTAPANVGVASAVGTATTLARADHAHASGNQRGQVTLVSGTITVSADVVITANTRIIPILVTPGAGASGTRYAVTGLTVGAAGVGAFTITAKDSGAGNNTVATDVSVLDWVAFEAAAV